MLPSFEVVIALRFFRNPVSVACIVEQAVRPAADISKDSRKARAIRDVELGINFMMEAGEQSERK